MLAFAPAAHAADRICTESLITMNDGVRLHAWVSRLAPDHPRPVLFMMDSYARSGSPGNGPSYGGGCPSSLPDDYVPAYLSPDIVDRFTLVQVSDRGTGASEGLFDVTGPRTQQDVHAAIAWAASQPWSTGDVVLTGESGTGFSEYHALHDPHVRAAVIFTSCADMYRCFYRGGEYNSLADVYFPVTQAGYAATLDTRNRVGTGADPEPAEQQAALAQDSAQAKADGVDDAWWQDRSALGALPQATVPVLYTSDLYDIVQPFDALQLTPNARFVYGMGHQSADTVAAGGANYTRLVRGPVDRFVAHYGLGDDNGAEHDPRVTLVTNTGSVGQFQAGQVLVRGEDAWPLPETRWTRLLLGSGTLDAQRGPDGSDTAALVPGPHEDLRTEQFAGGLQATDLSDEERGGLTYTTKPLDHDLEVSGPIALRLFASATAPDFDWSVRLTDVWPDGRSEWITDGYLRASLRKVDQARSLRDASGAIVRPWLTYDTPQSVPLGQAVEYQLDVIATSNVFRAGHRIRLDILPAADAEPDSARTGGAGAVTILRDAAHPSAVTLPVIPDRCADGEPLVKGTPAVSCSDSYVQAARSAPLAPVRTVRRCVSRRTLTLHLSRRLRSARVYLAGRLLRSVRGRRLRAGVDLRGLPAGRFTVRIVGRTGRGGIVVQRRRYRTCVPRR